MANISFTGLATGIDSDAIISKIVAMERARTRPLTLQKGNYEKQLSILGDLITKLKTLQTESQSRDTKSELSAFTATSADTTVFTATASGSAVPGTYSIKVDSLAQVEQTMIGRGPSGTSGFTATTFPGGYSGNLTITVNGVSSAAIAYATGGNLQDMVDAINNDTNIKDKVTATLLNTGGASPGYYIQVVGRNSGTANAISFSDSGNDLGIREAQAATDAQVTVNGVTVTRSDNKISDLFPGVTLELKKTNGEAVDLTINRDVSTQSAGIQKIVDAYNEVAKVINTQLSYNGVTKGQDTLFGDSALRQLQGRLTSAISTTYGGISLREIGISTNSDGTLKFDKTTFETQIAATPTKLETVFAGTSGLSTALSTVVDDFAKAGASETASGLLLARQSGINARIKTLEESITRMETNAEKLGDRLRLVFSNLESSISMLKSQGDQLMAALGVRR